MMKKLSELAAGCRGTVADIETKGALRRRIIDMGVTPGTEIRMLGSAPFGDPVRLSVRGYRLSMRKADAARIMVNTEGRDE